MTNDNTKTIGRYDLLTYRPLDENLAFDATEMVTVGWPEGAVSYRTEWVPLARASDGYILDKPALIILDASGNELMRSTDHGVNHDKELWDADVYDAECEREARLWGC